MPRKLEIASAKTATYLIYTWYAIVLVKGVPGIYSSTYFVVRPSRLLIFDGFPGLHRAPAPLRDPVDSSLDSRADV